MKKLTIFKSFLGTRYIKADCGENEIARMLMHGVETYAEQKGITFSQAMAEIRKEWKKKRDRANEYL